jgi:hypothetical protein
MYPHGKAMRIHNHTQAFRAILCLEFMAKARASEDCVFGITSHGFAGHGFAKDMDTLRQ